MLLDLATPRCYDQFHEMFRLHWARVLLEANYIAKARTGQEAPRGRRHLYEAAGVFKAKPPAGACGLLDTPLKWLLSYAVFFYFRISPNITDVGLNGRSLSWIITITGLCLLPNR